MREEKDRLTGVYTRDKAMELIQSYLSSTNEDCVALVMDIDNFKKVNNLFGVERGDYLLQDTANLLREFFREDDIISRLHGDQFIVLAKNCRADEKLSIRLHELCTTMEQEISEQGNTCRVSASIGVAVGTAGECKMDQLFYEASMAMDEVKKNGKGSVEFYHK